MPFEWVTAFKAIPPIGNALLYLGSAFSRMRGTQPTVDFTVGEYGPTLRVKNTRDATVIIEHTRSPGALDGLARNIGIIGRELLQRCVVNALLPARRRWPRSY